MSLNDVRRFYRIGQIPAYMLSRCTMRLAENENLLEVQTTPRRMMYDPPQFRQIVSAK